VMPRGGWHVTPAEHCPLLNRRIHHSTVCVPESVHVYSR
jgi:hypothetical protein